MIKLQTNYGDIFIELYEDKAPQTCANFCRYIEENFYDGLIFHRVIKNFMIQGGGFKPGMNQKANQAPIKNEANNAISNEIGTIAMARTSDPHSATSQFFINTKNNTFLDFRSETPDGWGYCVFGKVTDGLDVVKIIEAVSTENKAGHQDVPVDDVIIERAEIV